MGFPFPASTCYAAKYPQCSHHECFGGSRLCSPLDEATKPGWAADEPLRGVYLLQEVIGETLDDSLHVWSAALYELHHLQHTAETLSADNIRGIEMPTCRWMVWGARSSQQGNLWKGKDLSDFLQIWKCFHSQNLQFSPVLSINGWGSWGRGVKTRGRDRDCTRKCWYSACYFVLHLPCYLVLSKIYHRIKEVA